MSSLLSAKQPATERLTAIQSYYDELAAGETSAAEDIAQQISVTKPLADTVVIIPVAANQEAPQIANTLDQYAKQKTDRPFSLVLGLNCPRDYQFTPETRITQIEVEAAKERHPDLDVRTSFKVYEEPVIGQIRRDLWNGVLLSAMQHDQIDADRTIVGLNQDIDLMSMWPTSIRAIQGEYDKLARDDKFLPVLGMFMVHGMSPKHPNIGRAVAWQDHVIRQSGETFEAGLVIPVEMYAKAAGFDGKTSLGEVFTRTKSPHFIVPGAYAVTSPRRYLERVHTDGLAVWSAGNFSADEEYRTTDDYPDIGFDESIELIEGGILAAAAQIGKHVIKEVLIDCHTLRRREPQLFENIMFDATFIRELFSHRITRKQVVATRVLKKLTGSPELGEKLTGALPMDIPTMAERMHKVATTAPEPDQKTVTVKMS
jgi:hypothetical protein